jgi:hypothetical protein
LDKLQFIKEAVVHLGFSRDHIPGDFTLRVIRQRVIASVGWIVGGLIVTLLIKFQQRQYNAICVVLTKTLIM